MCVDHGSGTRAELSLFSLIRNRSKSPKINAKKLQISGSSQQDGAVFGVHQQSLERFSAENRLGLDGVRSEQFHPRSVRVLSHTTAARNAQGQKRMTCRFTGKQEEMQSVPERGKKKKDRESKGMHRALFSAPADVALGGENYTCVGHLTSTYEGSVHAREVGSSVRVGARSRMVSHNTTR